jgi:nitrogenase-stabilizing/protective protein
LESAEEFLEYFGIAYQTEVLEVSRLHILQRFHDYLAAAWSTLPAGGEPRREIYRNLLAQAYQDFVVSDPSTEKVFAVFRRHRRQVFVAMDPPKK